LATVGPPLYPVFSVTGLPQTLVARVIDFRSCRCRSTQLGLPKVFFDPPGGGHRRHDTGCLTHAVATCARNPSSGFRAVGTLGFWGAPLGDGAGCDNTRSQSHPVGGKASQAVSPGSPVGEYPPRKETPKSTHARRRPGEDAPSNKHELCDRKFTCPRRGPRGNTHASPSYPVRSPQTLRKPPPQTPSRDPQKTLPQTPSKEPQKTLPSGHMGPVSAEGGRPSDTALSRGGGRVLRDTLAAPRRQGRGVILVNGPSRVHTELGP